MLRVGVVIDTFQQPAWVRRVLEVIRSSNFAAIAAVMMVDSHDTGMRRPILRDWYSRLDAARFRQADDALEVADVRHLLADVPLQSDTAFDVVLAFAPHPPALSSRLGVWSVSDNAVPSFVADEPLMTASLRVAGAADRPDGLIGCAHMGTDRISLHRGVSRLYWKVATLIARELEALGRGSDLPLLPEGPMPDATSLQFARAATRAVVHEAAQKFRDAWMREQWFVAFRFDPSPNSPGASAPFQPMIPPRDRLWADPFVVVEGERIFVFVEEMLFSEHRGAIAYLEVRRDGTWKPTRRILERPYHLSYPCIFRWQGEFYMVPETSENRTVELYRCVDFPDRWVFAKELLTGVNAVDSTIFELNGLWWMYTATPSVGRTYDELSVFHADSPLGPWRPHRLNPVRSNVVGGRCAGAPFAGGGGIFRAAQNGARRYGHALQIRQIVKLTPDDWEETEIRDILPDWRPGLAGTHTFNHAGGVSVIDGLQYRWAI